LSSHLCVPDNGRLRGCFCRPYSRLSHNWLLCCQGVSLLFRSGARRFPNYSLWSILRFFLTVHHTCACTLLGPRSSRQRQPIVVFLPSSSALRLLDPLSSRRFSSFLVHFCSCMVSRSRTPKFLPLRTVVPVSSSRGCGVAVHFLLTLVASC